MQKYIDILEQHVQWIAIGLGALFVLFMTYAYVLNPPAKVEISGENYGPGEVDPHTQETVAQQLKAAIESGGKLPTTVPIYVQVFRDQMEQKSAKPLEIAGVWPDRTKDILMPATPGAPGAPGTTPPGPGGVQPPPGEGGGVAGVIDHLPVLPKAALGEKKHGRSVVLIPVAGQPAPPPPAPGAPFDGGVDKDWVTQLFKIDLAALDAAFTEAKIVAPPLVQQLTTTAFLQVEMEREELMPDGSWGDRKIIPPLETWRTNQPPPPFPPADAPRNAVGPYLQWATANTPDILQPVFYSTVPQKGDAWAKPGEEVASQQVVFDPSTHVGGKGTLSDEQWAQVLQWRREQQKLLQEQKKQQQPRTPRPPAGGRPGGGIPAEGDVMYAPAPAPAPARTGAAGNRSFAPAPRPAPRPVPVRPYPPPYGGRPGGGYPMEGDIGMEGEFGGYGAAPVAQGLPQPGVDYPNGEFAPADPLWKPKTIETWCHDVTVEPGKTYRYRIRYKIKNPIFASNASPKQELVNQFAIVSPESEWTPSIQVPEMINFFVASSKSPNANTVNFDVFTWDKGQTKLQQFKVGPGDLVGGIAKDGVDYQTKWTVVDFVKDARTDDYQILLVNNEDGKIRVRSYKTDVTDALYKALKEQVKTAADLAGTAAAANGGIVPVR